jgi:hypothetical protein
MLVSMKNDGKCEFYTVSEERFLAEDVKSGATLQQVANLAHCMAFETKKQKEVREIDSFAYDPC